MDRAGAVDGGANVTPDWHCEALIHNTETPNPADKEVNNLTEKRPTAVATRATLLHATCPVPGGILQLTDGMIRGN